jgi:3-hydroxy-9,10-secoandrosta-1,3,5(10)-triene-9,17-dione monooxygenase
VSTPRVADEIPAEGLVERVRALAPLILERSFDAERSRQPDDEVIEALETTGVFKSFVPRPFGGYEIDLETFVDIGLIVSEACASTGWITTFYMEHNWALVRFADELQAEIFARQPYILAPGGVGPTGLAKRVDGGYELSGRWKFGTGIVHADWVLLSGRIDAEDEPFPRTFLLPRDDVDAPDTWFVDGMAATGSHDMIVDAVHVPHSHVSLLQPSFAHARPVGSPAMHRYPIIPFLALTAAIPAVGCARRALALFRERLRQRVLFGTATIQAEKLPAQIRLAHAFAEVGAAESQLRDAASRIENFSRTDEVASGSVIAPLRLQIAHVVRNCRNVIRDILEASGASAHFQDHELGRIHRDIHMMSAHTIFDLDAAGEHYGHVLLKEATQPNES